MKKEEMLKFTSDLDNIPIGSLIWSIKKSNQAKRVKVVSALHNTINYPVDNFYKPISKVINFDEEDNL